MKYKVVMDYYMTFSIESVEKHQMVSLLLGLYIKKTSQSIGGHDPLYAPQSKRGF